MSFPPLPLHERFLRHIKLGDGCWEWTGNRNNSGYGYIFGKRDERGWRKNYQAHRLSWTFVYGPIPDGMMVCHHCDNRLCVRPGHLFLGTNDDNMKDMVSKGRARNSGQGERNHWSRLTDVQAVAARSCFAAGMSAAKIGKLLSVSKSCIQSVVRGRTYSHLPGAIQ